MTLMLTDLPETDAAIPPEVDLVISALDSGRHLAPDRRGMRRLRHRVQGRVRFFSDPADAESSTIYTRDIHSRGIGFITRHRLPLGHGGRLMIPHPAGGTLNVQCTLCRCRAAAPGWYEGSIQFIHEQESIAAILKN